MLLSLLSIGALTTPAMAWEHEGHRWDTELLRVSVNNLALSATLPQTLDEHTGLYYQELVIFEALCNWKWTDLCAELLPDSVPSFGAECAELDFERVEWGEPSELRFVWSDDSSAITSYDYDGTGNLIGAEIPLHLGEKWVGSKDECEDGQRYIETHLTHEVGHVLGMGHSCEDAEVCEDPFEKSTMFWNLDGCDLDPNALTKDDIEGLTNLYGPSATWVSDPPSPFGSVPLDVEYTLISDYPVGEVTWKFGDGETATGEVITHTYTTQDQFSLNVEYTLKSEECGEWTNTDRALGHVLVCDVPEPYFTYRDFGLGSIVMENETPMTTYGCVDEVAWEVWDGETLLESLGAWEPEIILPDGAPYRVVLTVGGPAGEASAELEIASDMTPKSCSVPAPVGILGMLISAGVVFRRREERA